MVIDERGDILIIECLWERRDESLRKFNVNTHERRHRNDYSKIE